MRRYKRDYRRSTPLQAPMGQKKQTILALLAAGMGASEVSRVTGWNQSYCCRLHRDTRAS